MAYFEPTITLKRNFRTAVWDLKRDMLAEAQGRRVPFFVPFFVRRRGWRRRGVGELFPDGILNKRVCGQLIVTRGVDKFAFAVTPWELDTLGAS